ncbi:MAG: RNA degradosome polyphosphate kinase, partial [bacterium]
HAKIALIRKETKGKIKKFAFLGTGNFNEKTAKIYADHGYFTTHEGLTNDLETLFYFLEDHQKQCNFNHILVPNCNLIPTFLQLIEREIQNVKNGGKGYIIIKMNGLEEPTMITALYKASEAGVKIDCIIRGICCLKPGEPYSKNIRVIRIVDRFLEHARVCLFYNNGENNLYLGSADWMKRNLHRRVECVFPVFDPENKKELIDLLNIQLKDNVSARLIGSNLENIKIKNGEKPIRAQFATYEYLSKK